MSQLRQIQRTVSLFLSSPRPHYWHARVLRRICSDITFVNSHFSIPLIFLSASDIKWDHRRTLKLSESDYAILTREFEDHVDEKVLEAVMNASATVPVDLITAAAATVAAASANNDAATAADGGVVAADADCALAPPRTSHLSSGT